MNSPRYCRYSMCRFPFWSSGWYIESLRPSKSSGWIRNRSQSSILKAGVAMTQISSRYTANGHNLHFPYAPSPSGGGLGWGSKSADCDSWQYKWRYSHANKRCPFSLSRACEPWKDDFGHRQSPVWREFPWPGNWLPEGLPSGHTSLCRGLAYGLPLLPSTVNSIK